MTKLHRLNVDHSIAVLLTDSIKTVLIQSVEWKETSGHRGGKRSRFYATIRHSPVCIQTPIVGRLFGSYFRCAARTVRCSVDQCFAKGYGIKRKPWVSAPMAFSFKPKSSRSSNYSTTTLRGLTCSAFGRFSVKTPFSTRALIFAVSIAGSSTKERRKSRGTDSR